MTEEVLTGTQMTVEVSSRYLLLYPYDKERKLEVQTYTLLTVDKEAPTGTPLIAEVR